MTCSPYEFCPTWGTVLSGGHDVSGGGTDAIEVPDTLWVSSMKANRIAIVTLTGWSEFHCSSTEGTSSWV
jgi:hypothetical protein